MKKFLSKAIPKLYGFYFNILAVIAPKKAAQLALDVFSIPRKGFITSQQQEFLNTARQQRVAYEDGLVMLYHWQGNGPTILLPHGWESNSARWRYLIEPLQKKDYNIIAIDAPAHGKTTGKFFNAIKYSKVIRSIIELYEPEVVIAHSVGAMATVLQESETPHDFINKIILLGSPDELEVIMKGYQQVVGFNKRVWNLLDQLLKEKFGYHIAEFKTSSFATKIQTPVLLIHDTKDLIVPYESMDNIATGFTNSTVYTSKTGGHSLHTPEVIEQVLKFLEKS
ncbi:MAG: alpha/beta hydrolase [Bacteroidota bacterium]|nr:alpha/beta hydrolase [Bacteroidota bacterium]